MGDARNGDCLSGEKHGAQDDEDMPIHTVIVNRYSRSDAKEAAARYSMEQHRESYSWRGRISWS